MAQLNIIKKKGSNILSVLLELNDKNFKIESKEAKIIEIPAGKYLIVAKSFLGFEGSANIDISESENSISISSKPHRLYKIIGILILTLIFTMSIILKIIPLYIFYIYLILSTSFNLIYYLSIRKNYYKFDKI